jgi:hypothetical protein
VHGTGGVPIERPTEWIPPGFDWYAIGVQECGSEWVPNIMDVMGEGYWIVGQVQMWEIGLLLVASPKFKNFITNVEVMSKKINYKS